MTDTAQQLTFDVGGEKPTESLMRISGGVFTARELIKGEEIHLQALRAVDRYGVTRRGEQYAGWKQLAAGSGASVERGRGLIRDHGGVTQALKATHPDHGGSADDFADVQAAREAAVIA